MTTNRSSEERAALAALLRRHGRATAWAALSADGWLETYATGADWALAGVVDAVVGSCAVANLSLGVGAHLAAASALAEIGREPSNRRRLGVATDSRVDGEELRAHLWGHDVTDLVVEHPDGGIAVVSASDCSITRTPLMIVDGVEVKAVRIPRSRLGPAAGDDEVVARHHARMAFILACEATAVAEAALGKTLSHISGRKQFGRPLAAFQAVQHRVVDMRLGLLVGQTLVSQAISEWQHGGTAGSWRAKLHSSHHAPRILSDAIQLHGAIGFTEEYGLGPWLRTTQRCRLLLGGPGRGAAQVLAATPWPDPAITDWAYAFDPHHADQAQEHTSAIHR